MASINFVGVIFSQFRQSKTSCVQFQILKRFLRLENSQLVLNWQTNLKVLMPGATSNMTPCSMLCNYSSSWCVLYTSLQIFSNPGLPGWTPHWLHTAQEWCVSITLIMQRAHHLMGGNTVSCWAAERPYSNTAPSSTRIMCWGSPLCFFQSSFSADCKLQRPNQMLFIPIFFLKQ